MKLGSNGSGGRVDDAASLFRPELDLRHCSIDLCGMEANDIAIT